MTTDPVAEAQKVLETWGLAATYSATAFKDALATMITLNRTLLEPLEDESQSAALAAGNTALRKALDSLLPGPLCGEAWGLPDTEKVAITVTFGAIRKARALLGEKP